MKLHSPTIRFISILDFSYTVASFKVPGAYSLVHIIDGAMKRSGC